MINDDMKSILNSRKYRRIILASLFAIFLVSVSMSSYVQGYTFPGGSGGSCRGGWCTGRGNVNAGWKLFPLSGSGPGGNSGRGFVLNSPTTWRTVTDGCAKYAKDGITQAYIFVTQYVNASSPYLGLNYINGWPGTPGYQDANPSGAYTAYLAAVKFDPGTASGTWGSTVAAFCYFDNPPWNVSVTTTVDRKVAEPGETIKWTHTITSNGPNSTGKDIAWNYQSTGDWPNITDGNWTFLKPQAINKTDTEYSTYIPQQSDLGKNLCRTTYASPHSSVDPQSTKSTTICVRIALKPKVDIIGGDLLAGNAFSGTTGTVPLASIDTSSTQKTVGGVQYLFGSWIEYGIFATGSITGAGSGAAYAGPGLVADVPTTSACKFSVLSFTNGGSSTCTGTTTIGNYASSNSIPDIASNFPVPAGVTPLGNGATLNLATNSAWNQVVTGSGSSATPGSLAITGGGGSIGAGKWLVINAPNTNVTITGDIHYTSGQLNSITDIPQLVIIARNITIVDSVTNVDAWLIAKSPTTAKDGVIATCSSSAPLTTATCPQQLTVNGPIMAQKLILSRTYESSVNTNSGDPAEIFNLRPDAYMWVYSRAVAAGRAATVYSQQLPPRL